MVYRLQALFGDKLGQLNLIVRMLAILQVWWLIGLFRCANLLFIFTNDHLVCDFLVLIISSSCKWSTHEIVDDARSPRDEIIHTEVELWHLWMGLCFSISVKVCLDYRIPVWDRVTIHLILGSNNGMGLRFCCPVARELHGHTQMTVAFCLCGIVSRFDKRRLRWLLHLEIVLFIQLCFERQQRSFVWKK